MPGGMTPFRASMGATGTASYDTGDLTANRNGFTGTARFVLSGITVDFVSALTCSQAHTDWVDTGITLPDDLRPPKAVTFQAVTAYGRTDQYQFRFLGGSLQGRNSYTGSMLLGFTGLWFVGATPSV